MSINGSNGSNGPWWYFALLFGSHIFIAFLGLTQSEDVKKKRVSSTFCGSKKKEERERRRSKRKKKPGRIDDKSGCDPSWNDWGEEKTEKRFPKQKSEEGKEEEGKKGNLGRTRHKGGCDCRECHGEDGEDEKRKKMLEK